MSFDFRFASLDDVDELVELEQECFTLDRLNQRNFSWMISRANASLILATSGGKLAGYALLLFHRGTSLARLYSIAVSQAWRGHSLGQRLLDEAQACALARNCAWLRLEVRLDNPAAIRLYEANGYHRFAIVEDYYEDHAEALRYEKRILCDAPPPARQVPYYQQTTEFTCGAACLLMAMAAIDVNRLMSRSEEIQLWREATTVFMTAGHGGCSPQGMALAAWRRGYDVRLELSHLGSLFLHGVRSAQKKAVMKLVEEGFAQDLTETSVEQVLASTLDVGAALEAGFKPVVLISSYRFTRLKAPHWVIITGCDDEFVYLHDPDIDHSKLKRSLDCQHLPISHEEFLRMSVFGVQRVRAAVMLRAR
ncbi:GNAT family N-acetyltransferase/peptidase C39 family protein [Pseudomonas viridiflava]|jgi:ribosomal protein S18 acetylase RimI-like enzyme/predicted double-glycine peptidase|uniref:GNAT family N-acetyltransferase/peptidase C39 family protein n=2 Tax=Pseudomonas TaxID=286 RepID=A0A8I0CU89_9PSED|nr:MULTISPECIES: GNAT family N-acetyltransferase/peptidase C39 family protein [Pseudomonas]MEE3937720.1 GNAT family N-acetyltransferase/peptidase C39 family protein [Pseudomonas viridiflava]MBP2873738.1 GNAT family N-acetyltransferase/peptidase C39 family protein [Pseudomonas sp. SWRI144]MEE4042520.1 GNAT family N-acetyltransferase/peptidase C39 family protein [Pseudomonas viridiflava]MEE4062490.1 GNAT family N-acetyltransferase/peptidase C39 family protein [Pseudomonas viridiflava]MEE4171870.